MWRNTTSSRLFYGLTFDRDSEIGHFHKALAHNQVWFAYGSLETMRHSGAQRLMNTWS